MSWWCCIKASKQMIGLLMQTEKERRSPPVQVTYMSPALGRCAALYHHIIRHSKTIHSSVPDSAEASTLLTHVPSCLAHLLTAS
jgi:hypothetical protein